MNTYEHTQPGTVLRLGLGLPAVLMLVFTPFIPNPAKAIFFVVSIILGLSILLFHSLKVSIDENRLRLRAGVGLIKIEFPLKEISKACPVRNKWYHGWGIHLLANGYLYNVSGLDSVEIQLISGAVHRIGTDEPSALSQAINLALYSRGA